MLFIFIAAKNKLFLKKCKITCKIYVQVSFKLLQICSELNELFFLLILYSSWNVFVCLCAFVKLQLEKAYIRKHTVHMHIMIYDYIQRLSTVSLIVIFLNVFTVLVLLYYYYNMIMNILFNLTKEGSEICSRIKKIKIQINH